MFERFNAAVLSRKSKIWLALAMLYPAGLVIAASDLWYRDMRFSGSDWRPIWHPDRVLMYMGVVGFVAIIASIASISHDVRKYREDRH